MFHLKPPKQPPLSSLTVKIINIAAEAVEKGTLPAYVALDIILATRRPKEGSIASETPNHVPKSKEG